MKCLIVNDKFHYRIYQSTVIKNHHKKIISEINLSYDKFVKNLNNKDINTLAYSVHKNENNSFVSGISNVFSLMSPSILFHDLYTELRDIIKDYLGENKKLYLDCWLNYFHYDTEKILCWHSHASSYHGYISLDPQNSITDFGDYQINNEIGQIYIGLGNQKHRVLCEKKHETPRITIGFDVEDKNSLPDTAPAYDVDGVSGFNMYPLI
jgi:hypothetical protein